MATSKTTSKTVFTIGYEGATMPSFLAALAAARVELLVDIRATDPAQEELDHLIELTRSGRRLALLCFEADPMHCHRHIVAAALAQRLAVRVEHLFAHDAAEDA